MNKPAGNPTSPIHRQFPIDFQWQTLDPFLFCVHHKDAYPKGNGTFGPAEGLDGRALGQDFTPTNGYRMYHGKDVPGFPVHPHRGFETITIVTQGYVDHADSLGAAGRYGNGDVQWMTAGAGIQHCEMFPLLKQDEPNPLELFQIWINLPRKNKMVQPHFQMLWNESIPQVKTPGVTLRLIAGEWANERAPAPPPESWASNPENGVRILLVDIQAGSIFELPPSPNGQQINCCVYFFEGEQVSVGNTLITQPQGIQVKRTVPASFANPSKSPIRLLLLESRPIGEPVVQHGPFVMNTPQEIQQAFFDYQRTQFGGWPWPRPDTVHGSEERRFARHPDGREDVPG